MAYYTYQIEVSGLQFLVEYEPEYFMGEPWKEECGHGPVSDWTTRDKRPGELVLAEDRKSKRFYDFAAACKIALRDGWDSAPYNTGSETKRQQAAKAARADFERMRGWCNDAWGWCGITVTLLDDDGEKTDTCDSCGGYASDEKEYLAASARDMAETIADQVQKTAEQVRDSRIVREALVDCRSV